MPNREINILQNILAVRSQICVIRLMNLLPLKVFDPLIRFGENMYRDHPILLAIQFEIPYVAGSILILTSEHFQMHNELKHKVYIFLGLLAYFFMTTTRVLPHMVRCLVRPGYIRQCLTPTVKISLEILIKSFVTILSGLHEKHSDPTDWFLTATSFFLYIHLVTFIKIVYRTNDFGEAHEVLYVVATLGNNMLGGGSNGKINIQIFFALVSILREVRQNPASQLLPDIYHETRV